MRVIVCGGRDVSEVDALKWLQEHAILAIRKAGIQPKPRADMLIHGDAKGVDKAADKWGRSLGIIVMPVPAEWDRYKRQAGAIRNARMLVRFDPDVTLALPGNKGTADMINKSLVRGVPVIKVDSLTGPSVKLLRKGQRPETLLLKS